MSGSLLLDWAALSISLFNTLVLVWLGLAVLLNAERRTPGVWLAAAGLLMGGAFFISHSAILGQQIDPSSPGLNFWWSAAWLPVILAPFAWYIGKKEVQAIKDGTSPAAGQGTAMAGMILGIIGTIFLVLAVIWIFFAGGLAILSAMSGAAGN